MQRAENTYIKELEGFYIIQESVWKCIETALYFEIGEARSYSNTLEIESRDDCNLVKFSNTLLRKQDKYGILDISLKKLKSYEAFYSPRWVRNFKCILILQMFHFDLSNWSLFGRSVLWSFEIFALCMQNISKSDKIAMSHTRQVIETVYHFCNFKVWLIFRPRRGVDRCFEYILFKRSSRQT